MQVGVGVPKPIVKDTKEIMLFLYKDLPFLTQSLYVFVFEQVYTRVLAQQLALQGLPLCVTVHLHWMCLKFFCR
jgi:hypothetical protein